MKIFISSLILMISILLALGLLFNPAITTTSAFSQGDSVYIAPRAADPNMTNPLFLNLSACR